MTLLLVAALVLTQSAPPLVEPPRGPLTPQPGVVREPDPAWTATEQTRTQRAVKHGRPRVHARSLCLACFPTGGAMLAAGFIMSVVASVSLATQAPRFEDRAWAPMAGVLGAVPFVGPIVGLVQRTNSVKTTTLFALSLVSEVTGTVLMVLGALREKPPIVPSVVPVPGGAAATLGGVW